MGARLGQRRAVTPEQAGEEALIERQSPPGSSRHGEGVELYSQVLTDLPGPDIPKVALSELMSKAGAPSAKQPADGASVH